VAINAYSATGAPITQFDSVRYVFGNRTDTARVSISPTGLVTARTNTGRSPVTLTVLVYKDQIGAADQLVMQATDAAIPGVTLSIQPGPSDSTKLPLGDGKNITPVIRNSGTGASVSRPQFRLGVSHDDARIFGCYRLNFYLNDVAFGTTTKAIQRNACATTFGFNQIRGAGVGTGWVHADALIYGVMQHDSVRYTVTNPYYLYVGVSSTNLNTLCPGSGAVAPGARVTFFNGISPGLGMSVAYTFDDPSAASDGGSSTGGSSGNITPLAGGESSDRIFMTPGSYTWHSAVSGATPPFTNFTCDGTLVVQ